jgi:hypothetical protein
MDETRKLGPGEVICRKCGCGPYVPDLINDFYVDNVNGPGTGLCEKCFIAQVMAPKDQVQVEDAHCENVCKRGQGAATCRFLTFGKGFSCAKGSGLEPEIQSRADTMRSKGNNCSGPPEFKPN